MKCGSPIEWASARAWATADDEQQLRSPSFSASAHSSSVTATVSPRSAQQKRGDCAVDAPAHRHQRPRADRRRGEDADVPGRAAPSARARASAASSAACSLPGLSPPSSAAIVAGPRFARRRAPSSRARASPPRCRRRSRHRTPGRRSRRPAVRRRASRPRTGSITARAAVGGEREVARRDVTEALGRGQVVLECNGVHPREDRTPTATATWPRGRRRRAGRSRTGRRSRRSSSPAGRGRSGRASATR